MIMAGFAEGRDNLLIGMMNYVSENHSAYNIYKKWTAAINLFASGPFLHLHFVTGFLTEC